MTMPDSFEPLPDRWDDDVAASLGGVGRLVYRSNLLGGDWRMTNTGGGNTSSKVTERDPLTGADVDVLWVKGSGGDLRTAGREHFASLYLDRLRALPDRYAAMPARGVKSPAEDAMVGMVPHTAFGLNPRAPSIDTPLHAFIPYRHVDHMHPVAAIAVATAADGPELTRRIWGDEVVWIDWMRPGFELGLVLERMCREHPHARGALLGGHGLIDWADDDRDCYRLTLRLVNEAAAYLAERGRDVVPFGGPRFGSLTDAERLRTLAETLPWLRGRLSGGGGDAGAGRDSGGGGAGCRRVVATVEWGPEALRFAGSMDAERLCELGTSCPDHFLRTRIKPLYVPWDPSGAGTGRLRELLDAGLERYAVDYRAYYASFATSDSPPIRGTDPTVFVIPGLGLVGWGRSKSESRVTTEFLRCAVEVMRGAESASTYTALPRREAFDIEYWALEDAKLRRMPPEAELARRVAVVVGGGSGIGRETARRLAEAGAAVAVLDRSGDAAEETVRLVEARAGRGIGVAGSGVSSCGDAVAVPCDVAGREAVRQALDVVTIAYGGFDDVIVTSGVYPTPDTRGRVRDEDWDLSFRVNVTGPYVVTDEARRVWDAQALDAGVVIVTSVNAVVPKDGSLAYDTSKAAANHLVRELAVALAPRIRVNGVAPATVVAGSAMFPRERVIASLAKYGLPWEDAEDDGALRARLARFYADRTLTRQPVRPGDVAEAIFLLVSQRLARTTGQILHVDGGLRDAFLR